MNVKMRDALTESEMGDLRDALHDIDARKALEKLVWAVADQEARQVGQEPLHPEDEKTFIYKKLRAEGAKEMAERVSKFLNMLRSDNN